MSKVLENVIGNLQQRIGELVSQYETTVAVLRAQATDEVEKRDQEIEELKKQLEEKNVPKKAAEPADEARPED